MCKYVDLSISVIHYGVVECKKKHLKFLLLVSNDAKLSLLLRHFYDEMSAENGEKSLSGSGNDKLFTSELFNQLLYFRVLTHIDNNYINRSGDL